MIRTKTPNQSLLVAAMLTVLLQFFWMSPALSQQERCAFSDSSFSFAGRPQEQAKCLLRPVMMYARLGAQLESLPTPLDRIIGEPINITKSTFQKYLNKHRIDEKDIGGALTQQLSRANNNDPSAPYARYFIIHDTSTPNYLNDPLPANINENTWRHNDLSRWNQRARSKAHVFINRVGESLTAIPFHVPWRSTKFELEYLKTRGKGLFLNIELVQPRRRDPRGGSRNDAIAPEPGFTRAQLDRLAVVYIAASIRNGDWLIPAFHAVLDAGMVDAHDDPQNFDLTQWAQQLETILESIDAMEDVAGH